MSPTRNNMDYTVLLKINNPVSIIYTPAPVSTQISFQGFRLSNPFKWLPLYLAYQRINAL